jgi:hypothetical protein
MKKLLLFAVVAFAIMSFGTHIGLVHAQTANPTVSTATLEQELQVAKATLVNLEMEAGMVPQGDAGLPSGSTVAPAAPAAAAQLSAPDRVALSSALGSLVSALSSFNATIAANPQAVTSHQAAIASVLSGMQSTLVAMNSAVQNGSFPGSGSVAAVTPAPIAAATQPATPAPASAPIASNQPTSQPSTGSLAPTAAPAGTNDQAQTAQVSSTGNFFVNHWPTITIIVLVALILLILFWPSKGNDNEDHGSSRPVAKPQAPNRPVATTVVQSVSTGPAPAASPVATVVSAPAAKVTVIRPQSQPVQQQKKPA